MQYDLILFTHGGGVRNLFCLYDTNIYVIIQPVS